MSEAIKHPDADDPEPLEAETGDSIREFLTFRLADESYALPLTAIFEIVKPPPITEVPRAPRDVLGIISVRGRVTTVVDLRRRLQMPEKPFGKATRVLLVNTKAEVLGILVDEVLQVLRLTEGEIEVATAVGSDTADYVMGIGRPQFGRGVGRTRGREVQESERQDDVLILLEPEALLKR